MQKVISRGPGTSDDNEEALQKLKDENVLLMKMNSSLIEEFMAINKKILNNCEDDNEHMFLFMHTLNPLPPPS